MKYQTLLRVLDCIRSEAPSAMNRRYLPDDRDIEKVNQARARAYIHLYLKVKFGITEFVERERTITDSSGDGGIDGYHIDTETKAIHLLQAKFRTTQKNFERKEIDVDEILAMDIDRVLSGESTSEAGDEYNGKIKQLQREISAISDIARYTYKVVILANLSGVAAQKIRRLTGGYAAEIFDFEKTYELLVFPVISGTYYTGSDIVIPFDLSSKMAGSKISYNVTTKYGDCEITVLFVPTLEIAKVMDKYRNAILQYNPRSYLDLAGQSVNAAIRDTILCTVTNEFALFNNGITMLSEETYINERIGQKNKAQLRIKNPQIINGGQTSFTLSRIYGENPENSEAIFLDKEVLLKVITLLGTHSALSRLQLIDEISTATNKQTPVITADKFSNDSIHKQLQRQLFETTGLLYERKRGEFSDGLREGYILSQDVIERNHFWRLLYTVLGKVNTGFQKKLFQKNKFIDMLPISDETLRRLYLGNKVFNSLQRNRNVHATVERDTYGKVYAYLQLFLHEGIDPAPQAIDMNLVTLAAKWEEFMFEQASQTDARRRTYFDQRLGQTVTKFDSRNYYHSAKFEDDLIAYPWGNRESGVGANGGD